MSTTVRTADLEGAAVGADFAVYSGTIATDLICVTKFSKIFTVQAMYNEAAGSTELIATWSGGTATITGSNKKITVLILGRP